MDGRSSDKHSRVLDQDDGVHGPHLNCAPQHKQSKRFKHFKHFKKLLSARRNQSQAGPKSNSLCFLLLILILVDKSAIRIPGYDAVNTPWDIGREYVENSGQDDL